MAERTETEEVKQEKEVTFYECDKCHGRFHGETRWKDDLNIVAFNARTESRMYTRGHNAGFTHEIEGDEMYLLCDKCCEDAHDYLADFF